LVCFLAIAPASAFQSATASESMKEIIAHSDGLTALELQYVYSDNSLGREKIWTDYIVSPGESFCGNLERILSGKDEKRDLTQVIFSTVSKDTRISYQLSEKSVFEKLSEPVPFPEKMSIEAPANSVNIAGDKFSILATLSHTFGLSRNGRTLSSYWATSTTSPSTVLSVMSAETRIKVWSGYWADSYYVGKTLFNTPSVTASDGSTYTMTPGTYKQFAHFQGYNEGNVPYSADYDNPSFVVS
jgi:hypothetical protein